MQFKCGSWLACDRIAAVSLKDRIVCIAGKPAPTKINGVGYCAAGNRKRAMTGKWLEMRNVSSCLTFASTRLMRGL